MADSTMSARAVLCLCSALALGSAVLAGEAGPAAGAQCGAQDLCAGVAPDAADLRGHLPWTVALVTKVGYRSVIRGAGVLVRHNAVLTAASNVVLSRPANASGAGLALVPAEDMTVLWTDAEGRDARSGVQRLEVRGAGHDVALLVLKAGDAIPATPVCLLDQDGAGDLVPSLRSSGAGANAGLVETWQLWGPAGHRLQPARVQECPESAADLCVSVDMEGVDSHLHGGGLLVNLGDGWYAFGLITGHSSPPRPLLLASDLGAPDVRAWLRGKLDGLEKVAPPPTASSPHGACVGARPSPSPDLP